MLISAINCRCAEMHRRKIMLQAQNFNDEFNDRKQINDQTDTKAYYRDAIDKCSVPEMHPSSRMIARNGDKFIITIINF